MRVGVLARIFSWLWLCCAIIANVDVIGVFDDKNNKKKMNLRGQIKDVYTITPVSVEYSTLRY